MKLYVRFVCLRESIVTCGLFYVHVMKQDRIWLRRKSYVID